MKLDDFNLYRTKIATNQCGLKVLLMISMVVASLTLGWIWFRNIFENLFPKVNSNSMVKVEPAENPNHSF